MLPVIALVGRPNVGKSTLFNRLTNTRDALVADEPGVTRDRKYGFAEYDNKRFIVIDTGGLSGDEVVMDERLAEQSWRAMEEADQVVFIVDGQTGTSSQDHILIDRMRRLGKPVWLAVNKTESKNPAEVASEFYDLGLGEPHCIAAKSGERVTKLLDVITEDFSPTDISDDDEPASAIKLAVVGRPNVGKSTLINRWLGEDRVIALDQPGTTRDSIYVPFNDGRQDFVLIDTAGVRRKARVKERLEKFSIVQTLQAIDDAHVVVMVLDAHDEITDQDASLLGLVVERGRALVIAVNKWDGMTNHERAEIKRKLELKLTFADYAKQFFISALHGTAVGDVLRAARKAYFSAMVDMPTAELNKILEQAMVEHPPPTNKKRRPKLRYAHQGGKNPPLIIVHGSHIKYLRDSYKRYLTGRIRKVFRMVGTPIKLEMRD